MQGHRPRIHVGYDPERRDVACWYRLEPHGLPDPRHRRVPDPARFEYLLPAGLVALIGRIPHANDQFLLVATDPTSGEVVFKAKGALDGGNVQIHPPNGGS